MGKPLAQGISEAEFSGEIIQYYADNAERFLADEVLEVRTGVDARIRKSPQGVILGIMPWNFPYYQVARFAFPNLMLGNTVLLKHAPQCPWSATVIAEILEEAGLPAGAYENIFATNAQIGEIVIPDPRVRGVSLTGSERAGAAVAEIAGRHLKKVVLELGGSDPFIVLSADDLDAVVEAAVETRMENSGQSCNASKRFIVIDELYDDVLDEARRGDHGAAGRRARGRGRARGPALVAGRCRPAARADDLGRRGGCAGARRRARRDR